MILHWGPFFFLWPGQGGPRIGKKYRISKMGVKRVGKLISEGFGVSMSKSGKILKILSAHEIFFSLNFFLMF